MFESLSDRLGGVFDRLTKQGALSEDDVRTAMREVRVALLEADVSLPVARDIGSPMDSRATAHGRMPRTTDDTQLVCHKVRRTTAVQGCGGTHGGARPSAAHTTRSR